MPNITDITYLIELIDGVGASLWWMLIARVIANCLVYAMIAFFTGSIAVGLKKTNDKLSEKENLSATEETSQGLNALFQLAFSVMSLVYLCKSALVFISPRWHAVQMLLKLGENL